MSEFNGWFRRNCERIDYYVDRDESLARSMMTVINEARTLCELAQDAPAEITNSVMDSAIFIAIQIAKDAERGSCETLYRNIATTVGTFQKAAIGDYLQEQAAALRGKQEQLRVAYPRSSDKFTP